jgi:hypothetical protein
MRCPANAKFLDAQTFSNKVRIGCMLVEDSIYDFQANNNTSPIDTVFHRYVLRNAYGGIFGKPNSVPAAVTANQVVTFNVTDTIPSNFNKSRLHLIPTIQYYNATTDNYEVLNVRRFSVKELLNTSGFADLDNQLKFSVYPNPAKNNLTIESNMTSANLNITITDMVGRKVLSTSIRNQKTSTISISTLASGTYVISISDGNETINRQLVIQ